MKSPRHACRLSTSPAPSDPLRYLFCLALIWGGCARAPDGFGAQRLTTKRLEEIQHYVRLLESRGRLPYGATTVPALHERLWTTFESHWLNRRRELPLYDPGVGFLDGWGEPLRLLEGPGLVHYSTGPDRIDQQGEGDDLIAPRMR